MNDFLEDSPTGQTDIKWSWNDEKLHRDSGRVWAASLDFLRKEGKYYRQIKSIGKKHNDLNHVIEITARYESGSNNGYPHVIRDFSTIEEWKSKETIPTKQINSKIIKKFNVAEGDNITLFDEGKFRIYSILSEGIYLENPWLKLISLEKDYIIAMSLNTLRQKLNISDHKRLNYLIVSDVDSIASYWRTIGHLLKHKAVLRIRTTPKTKDSILRSYEKLTGHKISKKIEEEYIDHNPNLKTFTDNAHLYFPIVSKEIRDLLYFPGNSVGKQKGQINRSNVEKIHNTEFVWTLFSYGFRLGEDHDSEKICNHVETNAKEFTAAFEEGKDEWLI